MASTAPPAPDAAGSRTSWKRPLLLGLCFAAGYAISQRLIQVQFRSAWSGHQRFEVKPFPGTELNSLRRKLGESTMEIRGDLDLLELERQQKQAAAAIEARRDAMAERERQQQQEAEQMAAPEPELDPAAELPELPDPEPPRLPEPERGPLLPSPTPDPSPTP